MSVPKARRYCAGVPAILIVIGDICRISKPASCKRATAALTTSPSEKKLVTVSDLIWFCPSNIETPPIERGETCANISVGRRDLLAELFLALLLDPPFVGLESAVSDLDFVVAIKILQFWLSVE